MWICSDDYGRDGVISNNNDSPWCGVGCPGCSECTNLPHERFAQKISESVPEILDPPHRSISQLKTYTRCGLLYKLERLERLGEFPAAWTALGSAFHETYHEWELSDRQTDWGAEFAIRYDQLIERARSDQPDLKLWGRPPGMSVDKSIVHYRKRGLEKDVPQYRSRCEESSWEVVALEQEFSIDLDGIVVNGAIDRIQEYPGDGLALEDLKTGSPDDEDDSRQLEFYGFVGNALFDYGIRNVRYWFTKLDRPGKWIKLSKPRDYWVEQFHLLNEVIEGGIFLPNPGKKCQLCSVKPWCSSQTATTNIDMTTAPRKAERE